MAIPRFVPGRGGERAHWAMPGGSWVKPPQAGFFQPPRRPPTMGGYAQLRPPTAASQFQQLRPPSAAAQFTQLRPPTRGVAGPGVGNSRQMLIHAIAQAAGAGPDAISPAGTPGRGAPAPAPSFDVDQYIQWLLAQQPRGPRSAAQAY